MGYCTEFYGSIKFNKPVTDELRDKVNKFNETRHEGPGYPGIWCDWIIDDDGELCWDGYEKFYEYSEWLEYLIKNFFEPEGYVLNGQVEFDGEEYGDSGFLVVEDNEVSMKYDIILRYNDPGYPNAKW